ncbi:MAG: transposase, partial [Chloroflexota bacterium]|nr:transposase [Chloroflexota bacterium]
VCPRFACTRSKVGARELTLHPRAAHEALQVARQRQERAEFKQQYAARAGVEGTLSQGADTLGMRHAWYVDLARCQERW